MYKGKVGYGAEPMGESRVKKAPKELRRTGGAYSHDHSRIQATQGKNELSTYKMKINGQMLDYIALLESEISDTKKRAEKEEKMFFDLVLNVSNFLGMKEVNKESIIKYMETINIQDGELFDNAPKANNWDWFDVMQQNRFKQFLYGAGGPQKIPSKPHYTLEEPADQKRKYKKNPEVLHEPRKKKRAEPKKSAQSKTDVQFQQSHFSIPGTSMITQPVQLPQAGQQLSSVEEKSDYQANSDYQILEKSEGKEAENDNPALQKYKEEVAIKNLEQMTDLMSKQNRNI